MWIQCEKLWWDIPVRFWAAVCELTEFVHCDWVNVVSAARNATGSYRSAAPAFLLASPCAEPRPIRCRDRSQDQIDCTAREWDKIVLRKSDHKTTPWKAAAWESTDIHLLSILIKAGLCEITATVWGSRAHSLPKHITCTKKKGNMR